MRRLKLQMQLSADGFVARPNGDLDWMTWNWDDKLKKYVMDLHTTVEQIVMGRKMAPGFIPYWEDVLTKPEHPDHALSSLMVNFPKVVFSKTHDQPEPAVANGKNTSYIKGDLVTEINKLKNQSGKDIITYGGAGFSTSLIANNLIDEYHLFINPTAIGKGLTIFGDVENKLNLELVQSQAYECGVVVNVYKPAGR